MTAPAAGPPAGTPAGTPAGPADLQSALLDRLHAPLRAWLAAQGADGAELQLGPPTVPGPDLAAPCHKLAKALRRPPQAIAQALAEAALGAPGVAKAEAAAGFLNVWLDQAALAAEVLGWARSSPGALGRGDRLAGQRVVIEYSSPNTNKPQHLGHCRNNLLGQAVSTLMGAAGAEVTRVNLINDRGIHICKSMLAWQRFGDGATPASTGKKGDHLIGDFYVKFDEALRAEYAAAFPAGAQGTPDGNVPDKDAFFNTQSEVGAAARDLLRRWEAGDPDVLELWRTMNGWCEAGFQQTYARMGVGFDLIDRESVTWTLGRELVAEGLERGIFTRLDDGAVAFELSRIGLEGRKIVLRADGTTLYITQDLGTALMRWRRHAFDRAIYVVGNEQDHYFKLLFAILAEIEPALGGRLVHRSYGMVELTTGKMKSREGTVIDADDLMDDLRDMVLEASRERWAHLDAAEQARRAEAIGLAGLKFYLLKFNPSRNFVFDKQTSIAIEGETGPYCQYAWARTVSLLAKAPAAAAAPDWAALDHEAARPVLQALLAFPGAVRQGAEQADPSFVTGATYALARAFSSFYNHPDSRILGAAPGAAAARVALVEAVQRVLGAGLELLGIERLPEM